MASPGTDLRGHTDYCRIAAEALHSTVEATDPDMECWDNLPLVPEPDPASSE